MIASQFIFTLFCTVFFCLGFRIITDEGQVFYFLRKPFDEILDKIEKNKNRIEAIRSYNPVSKELDFLIKQNWINGIIYKCGKPLVTCITCTASFWGIFVFYDLNSLHFETLRFILFNCVSASFIQTFIWKLYERL